MPPNARNKRDLIKRTAAVQFRRFSYSGTSMDVLAAELGMNKGTLYHYYKGKSDILYDVVTSALQGLTDAIAGLPASLSPDDYIRSLVRVSLEQSSRFPNETAVYFQESPWLEQALSLDQLAEVRRHERGFAEVLDQTVLTGQKEKHYRKIERISVRYSIVGMLGYVPSWYKVDGGLSLMQVADRFAALIIEGLVVPRRGSTGPLPAASAGP